MNKISYRSSHYSTPNITTALNSRYIPAILYIWGWGQRMEFIAFLFDECSFIVRI